MAWFASRISDSRFVALSPLIATGPPPATLWPGASAIRSQKEVGAVIPFTPILPSRREWPAPSGAFAVLILVVGATAAQAITNSHVEEFDNTTFKDAVNTTADWNTAVGKLQLFPFQPTLLGSYDTPSYSVGVAVSGTVACVGDGDSGLQIFNVSNPASPVLLGTYDTPGTAWGVAVSGTVAYVADGSSGLQIINISNPASPTLLGTYNTPDFARAVAVSGTVAYVADASSGLQIINVSNPASPTLLGSYSTTSFALGLAVSGTVAYVADATSGLQIINVSNPASPTLLGSYDPPGISIGVAVSGSVAYMADDASGLQIINVSNSASPSLLGSYDTPSFAFGVAVSGTVAYVADELSGIQIINVANPTSPSLLGSCDTPGSAKGISISGTVAYVADEYGGLQILTIGNPVGPTPLGSYDTPDFAYGVAVSGNVAYVADQASGLQILNVSNPLSPSLLGSYDTPGAAFGVAVSGPRVYVADHVAGLQIINVSNPASPALLGSYNTPGSAIDVAVAGTVAYVADGGSGLQILNVSNPASPALLGFYNTPGFAQAVAVSGKVAYVAGENAGLVILDVSNPASPTLLGIYNTPGQAVDVAIAGTVAYVADFGLGFQIIDVSNPASPSLLGSYGPMDAATGVALSGTVACISNYSSGLLLLDVSNPEDPNVLGSYVTPGLAYGVAVSGAVAYVPDVSSFQILEVMQNRFDLSRNVGRSLAMDGTSESIARVRLTSTQVNNVGWELSANGGASWQAATPGGGWVGLTSGSDLRWRATLSPVPPYFLASSPEASRVEVEWLYSFPLLDAITDVGNDQGRLVRLEWTRSDHDFVGASPQITEYAIYRRIDPGFEPLGSHAVAAGYGSSAAEIAEALAAGWDYVTTVPAAAVDDYSVEVPTLADSSIASGQHWTAFRVRARTATPGVYYESYPDSGYSVDNLSPAMPAPFAGVFTGGPSQLHWGASLEADFAYYQLHRGGAANFVPGPGNLVTAQPDTGYVDSGSSWAYYKIAAVDWNGNTGGYALVTPAASSSGNTPPGSNVTVAVSPIVGVTYQNVTGGGQTQVTMQTGGTVPPNGLKVAPGSPPLYYRITSTASFTGSLTICVTYDPDFITGQEKNLKLMHFDTALNPDAWVQVTTSRDTAANEICGVVTHLSEFALMELDETVVGVEDGAPAIAERLSCAPNPVAGTARIQYDLAAASAVRLGLFDLQGRLVRELERSPTASAGRHVVEWDGRGARGERLRAGIYFLWLEAGGTRQMRRVAVTR